MRTLPRILGVLAILLTLSCSKKVPLYTEKDDLIKVNMSRASSDVRLPTKLWTEIEKVFLPNIIDKASHGEDGGAKTKLEIPTDFFGFKVYLVEKTKGVLGGKNYELEFGRGGGTLDLRDYVQASKGTFFIGVQPDLDYKKDVPKIFFLSKSKKRKVGSEEFGAGCSSYLDISSYWSKVMSTEGIPVNVTNLRYVNLLSGTFFLAVSIEGKLWLSQFTVRDSRHKQWQCGEEEQESTHEED